MVKKKGLEAKVRGRKSSKLVLTRDIGSNAASLIAQLAASSKIASIEEFVANAYDSDAENIAIVYDEVDDILRIRDDGEGMDIDGLRNFFRLGDSVKVRQTLSSKGRRRMGKFGIATILLYDLANKYRLETVKGDEKVVVEEELSDERLASDVPIPFKTSNARGSSNGTEIELTALRIKKDEFSVDDLVKKLSWDFPVFLPDFSITVNGKEVQSARIDTERRYEIPEGTEVEGVGEISGNIHYTKSISPERGIHVYVNGRRVGNPTQFEINVQEGIAKKLVGVVFADGLEDAILFDRGRFKEDHPAYVSFSRTIKKLVGRVARDITGRTLKAQFSKSANKARALVRKAERILNDNLGEMRPDKGFQVKIIHEEEFNERVDEDERKIRSEVPALYDSNTGEVFVNESSPLLMIPKTLDGNQYESNLLHRIAEAVANTELRKKGTRSIDAFLEMKEQILSRIYKPDDARLLSSISEDEEGRKKVGDAYMSDMRHYTAGEVAKLIGRPVGIIRQLLETGFMRGTEDDILGSDAMEALKGVEGYTSLYEMLHTEIREGRLSMNSLTLKQRTIIGQFEKAGVDELTYVMNIGDNGTSCFFVMDELADSVADIVMNGGLNRVREGDETALHELDEFTSIMNAADKLDLPPKHLARAVEHAKARNLPLESEKAKRGYRYRFSHLIGAYHSMNG